MDNEKAPVQSRSINPCAVARRTSLYRHVLWIAMCVCLSGQLPVLCQEQGRLPKDPQKRIDQLPDIVAKLPASQDTVLAALADDDLTVRRETLKQLTNHENLPQPIRNAVTQLTSSQDPETRILAIGCLAHTGITNPAEIDAITSALGDPVATVRLAAIEATPMVEVSQKCMIDNVVAILDDPDTSVQLDGVKVLPKIKCDQSGAVPILSRLSEKSSSPKIRAAALDALDKSTANITETKSLLLRLALKDSDADVRRVAVRALQDVQALTSDEVASLAPLTHDPTSLVRQTAAYTLVILGRNKPNALDSPNTPQDADDQNARKAPVLALGMVADLQRDADEGVRDAVAIAFSYGDAETPFFSLIAKSLNDGALEVRADAVASLLKLKGEEDKTAEVDGGPTHYIYSPPDGAGIWPQELTDASLRALGQSQPASIREDIADAIRRYGAYDARLVKRLTELATADPDAWSRRACVRAIGNAETTPATLTALIAASHDSQPAVRKQALVGLGRVSSVESIKPNRRGPSDSHKAVDLSLSDIERSVVLRLDDKEVGVRLAAFHALESGWSPVELEDSKWPKLPTTKALLVKALQDEDPDIREAAAKTLQSVKLDESDIEALLKSVRDQNVQVGIQAAKTLASIDFPIDGVKQSVGLMPITFFDFTSREAVTAKTARELTRIAPKCHV